jgi:hypothetical protein
MKRGVVLVVCVALLGVGLFALMRDKPTSPAAVSTAEQTTVFKDEKTGLSLDVPTGLKRAELSTSDIQNRVSLRLGKDDEPISIVVRSETGLRAANPGDKDLLTLLLNNSSLSFPKTFTGYKLISQKQFDLHGSKAGEVLFTYTNQSTVIRQRFVIILKDQDTAQYLIFQSPDDGYQEANSKYFEPLVQSAEFTN